MVQETHYNNKKKGPRDFDLRLSLPIKLWGEDFYLKYQNTLSVLAVAFAAKTGNLSPAFKSNQCHALHFFSGWSEGWNAI